MNFITEETVFRVEIDQLLHREYANTQQSQVKPVHREGKALMVTAMVNKSIRVMT